MDVPQLDPAIQTSTEKEDIAERVEHYRGNDVRVRETRYLDLLRPDYGLVRITGIFGIFASLNYL